MIKSTRPSSHVHVRVWERDYLHVTSALVSSPDPSHYAGGGVWGRHLRVNTYGACACGWRIEGEEQEGLDNERLLSSGIVAHGTTGSLGDDRCN